MSNLSPQSIMDGMAAKNRMLTQKNDEYGELVRKEADAERLYNLAFARVVLEMKADGQSVTLIKDLVKGDKVVADAKFFWAVATGILKANTASCKTLSGQIDTYRSLLAWQKAEMLRQE